jgi:hypothetical protein
MVHVLDPIIPLMFACAWRDCYITHTNTTLDELGSSSTYRLGHRPNVGHVHHRRPPWRTVRLDTRPRPRAMRPLHGSLDVDQDGRQDPGEHVHKSNLAPSFPDDQGGLPVHDRVPRVQVM